RESQLYLAVQCCEHLNRALVVERECAGRYGLELVTVIPHLRAGGALSAAAMKEYGDPVVVESISAHAGMDIGDTFIGMHLRHVAVPVRLEITKIGDAHLTMARTRPKLIGGERALYPKIS
ncbi:MAG TPA: TIGR01440 family protein, partial [Bacillota bacterium]|nr:TIGR01440 family protein [Bacillota bacterium]